MIRISLKIGHFVNISFEFSLYVYQSFLTKFEFLAKSVPVPFLLASKLSHE